MYVLYPQPVHTRPSAVQRRQTPDLLSWSALSHAVETQQARLLMRSELPQIHDTSTRLQPPRSAGTQPPAHDGRPGMLTAAAREAKAVIQAEMVAARILTVKDGR